MPREIGRWKRRKQFSDPPPLRYVRLVRAGFFLSSFAQFTELYLKFESDSTILTYLTRLSLDSSLRVT